jgi:hypothetical protein
VDDRFPFFPKKAGLLVETEGGRFRDRACKLTDTHELLSLLDALRLVMAGIEAQTGRDGADNTCREERGCGNRMPEAGEYGLAPACQCLKVQKWDAECNRATQRESRQRPGVDADLRFPA